MLDQIRRRWDSDALLYRALLGLVIFAYVVPVYVGITFIGIQPFRNPQLALVTEWQRHAVLVWWLNWLALLVILLTIRPVYRWVRGGIHDLIYGQHENPYPVIVQLNQHLENMSSPHAILPTIAATIAQTLKLPFVEIKAVELATKGEDAPASTAFGAPPKGVEIECVPLLYHNTTVGTLRVAARRWDEPLSRSDLTVLHDLARQVGIALYAAQLTEDLQRTREQLVLGREEERRRIRNDLHDGLAPTLSSFQLQLGALRTLIHQDLGAAETLINELREDLRQTTAEIRQLVYALRPPLLDELGLVAALKNFHIPGTALMLEVQALEPLPPLPAALEVAVYRIASEALHNVVKHAQATACVVWIDVKDDQLMLSVTDNGATQSTAYNVGIGLQSMQERAAELGGTFTIQSGEAGGTCIIARLPIGTIQ